jgi:hypothetical protein
MYFHPITQSSPPRPTSPIHLHCTPPLLPLYEMMFLNHMIFIIRLFALRIIYENRFCLINFSHALRRVFALLVCFVQDAVGVVLQGARLVRIFDGCVGGFVAF